MYRRFPRQISLLSQTLSFSTANNASYHKIASNIASLRPSATLLINERSNAMIAAGKTIYKFGLGQSPFPVPECIVKELQAHAHEKDYLPVSGLLSLRAHYATFLNTEIENGNYDARNILVGPGSKELLFIANLAYDCEILLPNPSWVSYEPQAQIAGRVVHWLETKASDRWVLKPDVIDEHCAKHPDQPRMMILNFPSNPTGCTHRKHELQAIADVARKYNIVIIADEIYGRMMHDGEHVSLASLYPEGTIISNGLSKSYGAGGWRLGLWAFPDELSWLQTAMTVIASETYTSVSAPIQYAAKRAYQLNCPELTAYANNSRRVSSIVGRYVAEKLSASGMGIQDPEGGFYLFPDFTFMKKELLKLNISTSPELCERILIDTGVAMLPGTAFGKRPEELYLRLAYVDFDGAIALQEIEHVPENITELTDPTIQVFLDTACPKVLIATSKLVEWVAAVQST